MEEHLDQGALKISSERQSNVAGLGITAGWALQRALKVFWTPKPWARIRFDGTAGQIVHEVWAAETMVDHTGYPFDEHSRIDISKRERYAGRSSR